MSREKQNAEIYKPMCEELFNNLEKQYQWIAKVEAEIDELTTVLYEANHKKSVLDYHWLAIEAYNAGYHKVIRCKNCEYFMEYTSTHKSEVEKADGDCHIRLMNSENRQYCACQHDDFCSFAKMKGGAEE